MKIRPSQSVEETKRQCSTPKLRQDCRMREDCNESMEEALAIIPARGGSKGIYKKNLQEVGGIPLIQRTIEAAQKCSYISRVAVSTDDDEIATLARKHHAIAISRPEKLSSDISNSEDALIHAIRELQKVSQIEKRIAFLQCTSPFTTSNDIDLVIAALNHNSLNSSFAATPWHGFLWSTKGEGINHNPMEARKRRQDLEITLLETGSVYAMRTDEFIKEKTRFCLPTKPILVNHNPQEIDTYEDLELCRIMHKYKTICQKPQQQNTIDRISR